MSKKRSSPCRNPRNPREMSRKAKKMAHTGNFGNNKRKVFKVAFHILEFLLLLAKVIQELTALFKK